MRKIERPSSTTIVLEALFHECKTVEEVNNALEGVDQSDIVEYARMMDPNTFRPLQAIMIKSVSKPASEWMKYIIPLELKAE